MRLGAHFGCAWPSGWCLTHMSPLFPSISVPSNFTSMHHKHAVHKGCPVVIVQTAAELAMLGVGGAGAVAGAGAAGQDGSLSGEGPGAAAAAPHGRIPPAPAAPAADGSVRPTPVFLAPSILWLPPAGQTVPVRGVLPAPAPAAADGRVPSSSAPLSLRFVVPFYLYSWPCCHDHRIWTGMDAQRRREGGGGGGCLSLAAADCLRFKHNSCRHNKYVRHFCNRIASHVS